MSTEKKSLSRALAFDLGASSGRGMLGHMENGKLVMEEIHRFSNDPVQLRDTLYWDLPRLFFELKEAMRKAIRSGGFDSVGIDTWGVDFALLDKRGNLLANPVHYRDKRTVGIPEEVCKIIPKDELYMRTGTQFIQINTIFQLYALKLQAPDLLEQADCFLMTPDLLAYLFTGEKRTERTIASTTGLYDPKAGDWDFSLIERLGLPTRIFPKIISTGQIYGCITPALAEELGDGSLDLTKIPVVAVGAHDTASAVASAPCTDHGGKGFAFLSCGTWSLVGAERYSPLMTEETEAQGFTNEIGVEVEGSVSVRFLKNIVGLWLIQESRRQWIREGLDSALTAFDALESEARNAKPLVSFINPDAPEFSGPGNLPKRVKEFCQKTGQPVPESRGAVLRCIYESMALKYRWVIQGLNAVSGEKYSVMHMLGGGIKDTFLCELTAAATNMEVEAGPVEATAAGNLGVQLIAQGQLADVTALRGVIKNSFPRNHYAPPAGDSALWDEAYSRYKSVLGL